MQSDRDVVRVPFLPSLNPERRKMALKCSAQLLAVVIITIVATLSITVVTYKYGFNEESMPTPEASISNREDGQTNQNLTFDAKMVYIRNLSLKAKLPQLNSTENVEICETDGCFEAAQELLYTMDGKNDPCVNFFEFACGRVYYTKPESPMSPKGELTAQNKQEIMLGILQEENSTDLKPLSQAKLYFKQCFDLVGTEDEGLEVLLELIKKYGGWPLLGEKWNGSDFNWIETAAELRSSGIVSAFISAGDWMYLNNSSKAAIYMGYPYFGLPERALREPVKYSSIVTAYEQFAYSVINEMSNDNYSSVDELGLKKSVQEMINFEIKLAQLITYKNKFQSYKLSELENITGIEWSVYFNKVLNASDINVDGDEAIIVYDVDYLKGLKKLMESEKVETIANHFIWKVVGNLARFTNHRIRNIQLKFTRDITGHYGQDMDAICVGLTDNWFGFAIGAKYLENNVEWIDSNNIIVERLAQEMKASFIEIVGQANWIGNETKANIIEKIEGIRGFIGYPEWLLNGSEVEEYYDGLELGESYIESELKLRFWQSQKMAPRLRKPTDKNEWRTSVWNTLAQFFHQLNVFIVPFMDSLPPNYREGRPQHQNYAKLGWILGHEIMHGFDRMGRFFDKEGNMRNWWDEESLNKYEEKMDCITERFGQYNFSYPWSYPKVMRVDGEHTLGENMADVGATQISFRAYQKYVKENGKEKRLPGLENYTPEQLFFIDMGNDFCAGSYSYTNQQLVHLLLTDTHSPLEARLNELGKHSEDFRRVFNCTEKKNETSQVESENCQLW